ncbi:MAG: ABC transporter permease subunit, partial [Bacteroidota bacterium]
MWQIIKNEWQFLRRTKLMVGLSVGFAAVLLVAIIMANYQISKQAKAHHEAKHHLRAQWESIEAMNPHGAAHYGTYVFKPSNLLSSLDEGVNGITGNMIRVEGHVQNEMVHSEASQMQAVSRFGKLKSSLLLKYIIPLLLIFLAFSSVSTEKQSGRLRLIVLQGGNASKLVLAKSLAIWFYGIMLLLIVMISYSLLNLQSMDSNILQRAMGFFAVYALYYFIVCGLTTFLSARWQNPTLALTSMLGIWMVWTVFLPNILMSSVEKWHPLPSRNEFKTAMKEDRSKGIDGHNPTDERANALVESVLAEYGVDSLSQLPINFDGIRMQA